MFFLHISPLNISYKTLFHYKNLLKMFLLLTFNKRQGTKDGKKQIREIFKANFKSKELSHIKDIVHFSVESSQKRN